MIPVTELVGKTIIAAEYKNNLLHFVTDDGYKYTLKIDLIDVKDVTGYKVNIPTIVKLQ